MRGHERGGGGQPAGVSHAAPRDDPGTDLVGTRVRNAVDGKGAAITVRLCVSHASRATNVEASSEPRRASSTRVNTRATPSIAAAGRETRGSRACRPDSARRCLPSAPLDDCRDPPPPPSLTLPLPRAQTKRAKPPAAPLASVETTSSDRVEVIGSDDDAEDASCSTRAAPGAASPSDTDSDVAAGVELVDLVNDLETAAGSGLGGNKRDRDESAERSASPSTSSRSVRLKPDAAEPHREPKGVESASDEDEEQQGSASRGDSDSAARSAPVAKPLTPDRLGGAANDDGGERRDEPGSEPGLEPAPAPAASDATAVNTAAAIETVLEGLARDEKLSEEDEEQFEKIPETMLAVPLLRHQRRAVSWMRRREAVGSSPRGGMLADDQGLGKTFSAIALIAANPPPPRRRGNDASVANGGKKPAGGTLVVCPTSVLRQWQRELESKVSKSANMRVLVHHGVGRAKLAAELAAYDVVLTTFAVVGLEVASPPVAPAGAPRDGADASADGLAAPCDAAAPSGGAIGGVEWFRVVLDEAQSVKNARSQVAAAVSAVAAKCRWCLSGTPLQNNVDDLFSYFRFLRYEPYGDAASFRALIKEPIRVDPAAGFRRLQAILRAVMLRRTKQSRINGAPIVRLPPRIVVHSKRAFLPAEQKAYARLQAEYRGKMEEYAAAGTVSSNYVNLLHMLLRLRQACNHPSLVGGSAARAAEARPGADGTAKPSAGRSGTPSEDARVRLSIPADARVKATAAATAAARRLPAALRGMMRAAAERGRCVCSICGDPPTDPTVASCCARAFCGDCVSTRVDALPAASAPSKKDKTLAGAIAAADGLTADGFACPSCGTTLTRALLHSAAALVAADAPRGDKGGGAPGTGGEGLLAGEQSLRAPRDAPGGGAAKARASGPSLEALMAGTKVRGIMEYLTALREQHKAVLAAAKAKASSRGKAQTQKFSPGRAAAAAAVAKGTQLRRGIRSSDAALAAALPPLAPVCAPGGGARRSHAAALGSLSGGVGRGGPASHSHGAVPPAEKAIVFSQWTAMLDLLEPCLRSAGIHFRRLDGTMSLAARERALSEFEAKPDVTVILMSLKAAGLGVNLTCANHVLLSDVWWNPAAEEQAIDRAHRIGQTRPVRVARFTVRDTVEDRILALQDRKRAMVAAAFGDEADDGFGGSSRRAQLTTEDLVFLFGSEKEAR